MNGDVIFSSLLHSSVREINVELMVSDLDYVSKNNIDSKEGGVLILELFRTNIEKRRWLSFAYVKDTGYYIEYNSNISQFAIAVFHELSTQQIFRVWDGQTFFKINSQFICSLFEAECILKHFAANQDIPASYRWVSHNDVSWDSSLPHHEMTGEDEF